MNPRHRSQSNEQYTPAWLVEKARRVLGGIDLDPASSPAANKIVRARRIYTKRDNGLARVWRGRVFLNPPGGLVDIDGREVIHARLVDGVQVLGCTETGECGLAPGHTHELVTSSAVRWWDRLLMHFQPDYVTGAVFLGFSLELLQTVQDVDQRYLLDFAYCIPKKRIRFEKVVRGRRIVGKSPTHSNIIVCVTPASGWERFRREFRDVGYVGRPGKWRTK